MALLFDSSSQSTVNINKKNFIGPFAPNVSINMGVLPPGAPASDFGPGMSFGGSAAPLFDLGSQFPMPGETPPEGAQTEKPAAPMMILGLPWYYLAIGAGVILLLMRK